MCRKSLIKLFCLRYQIQKIQTLNEKKNVAVLLRSLFFLRYVVVLFFFGGGRSHLLYGVVFRRTLQNISSSAQIIHHIIMAFTKAFYEQAFERNLKAQTTTTTTTRQHADIVPTMTHTQRATLTTAMFTAHSKKEVVRQMYIESFFCV